MHVPISHAYMMMTTLILKPLFLNFNTTTTITTNRTVEDQPATNQKICDKSCDKPHTVHKASLSNHDICLLNQNTSLMDDSPPPMAEDSFEAGEEAPSTNQHTKEMYLMCVLNLLSLIIIPGIKILREHCSQRDKQDCAPDGEKPLAADGLCTSMALFDKGLLGDFYERCVHILNHESGKIQDFVGGFSDELLNSLRSVCHRETGIEVKDCISVGNTYELWRAGRLVECDLIVPFAAPEAYSFQCDLWCSPSSSIPPEARGCGRIMIEKADENTTRCLCCSADVQDEMLCLLHSENGSSFTGDYLYELLCSRNMACVSMGHVLSWFKLSVTKAWKRISHKYNFELILNGLDSTGDVKVRFRSRKTIIFNITPVIQYKDTDAYFVPHVNTITSDSFGTCWYLSFTVYEENLLKLLTKRLPENSCHIKCLQILSFMHDKQTKLTGKCALSSHHFKTILLHLLLADKPIDWSIEHLNHRLHDVLIFLEKSILQKRLYHVFIGNPQIPQGFSMPEIFRLAEPINLFHQLSKKQCYTDVLEHFEELLKNVPVVIQEYTAHFPNGKAKNIPVTPEM